MTSRDAADVAGSDYSNADCLVWVADDWDHVGGLDRADCLNNVSRDLALSYQPRFGQAEWIEIQLTFVHLMVPPHSCPTGSVREGVYLNPYGVQVADWRKMNQVVRKRDLTMVVREYSVPLSILQVV